MSLEKAIYHGKERRKPYYDSRRFDWSCRNHKSCGYCRNNRTFKHKKSSTHKNKQEQVNEFFGYWFMPDPSDVTDELNELEYEINKTLPNNNTNETGKSI
jgi:hypothetical protein